MLDYSSTPAARHHVHTPTIVLETERLTLRHLATDDAPFIVALLNDPDWLRFIGDKSVRTLDDARAYLRNGPIAMYAREADGLGLARIVAITTIDNDRSIRVPERLGLVREKPVRLPGDGEALQLFASPTTRHA